MKIKVILILDKESSQKIVFFAEPPFYKLSILCWKMFHEGSWNTSSYNARHIQIMTRGGAEGNHSVTLAPFWLAVSLIMSIFWAAGHWQRERGEEKGKSTQGSCSQARVTLASAQAAAFTYFPTLRLNLAQAFHSVSFMSRWTRRQIILK